MFQSVYGRIEGKVAVLPWLEYPMYLVTYARVNRWDSHL